MTRYESVRQDFSKLLGWYRTRSTPLRWFVVLVATRPIIDLFWQLKEISAVLSPPNLVGAGSVLLMAGYVFSSPRPAETGFVDRSIRFWGWLVAAVTVMFLIRYPSIDSVAVVLKYAAPLVVFLFLRRVVKDETDLAGLAATYLLALAVPYLLMAYEVFVEPFSIGEARAQLTRFAGLYADVVSYGLYGNGGVLAAGYLFTRGRIGWPVLAIAVGMAVLILANISHAASWGVFGFLVLTLIVCEARRRERHIGWLVVVVVVGGTAIVGSSISEQLVILFRTDLAVIAGQRDTSYLFHGRLGRWQRYLGVWEESNFAARSVGVVFDPPKDAILYGPSGYRLREKDLVTVMMSAGVHSDYLRQLFSFGWIGLSAKLLALFSIALFSLKREPPLFFAGVGSVGVLLLYGITSVASLYPPILYLCYAIIANGARAQAASSSR